MIRRFIAAIGLGVIAMPVLAQQVTATTDIATITTSEKACATEACASACSGCPIEAAMAKLPTMTYLVGDESTCCSKSAAKLAEKHDMPVKYVVAKKTFEDQGKATLALAETTEKFVKAFATPAKCEESGKFTVAGKELCCEVMAGQRARLAGSAMEKVAMTYLVGEKKCACPNEAAAIAKSSGVDQVYLVAGEKTCCSIDARLKLARAKYRAAVEALAKADAPEQAEAPQS